MNITRKANIRIVAACMLLFETNCGSIGQGFAGYEKPAERFNKYYRENVFPAHSKLLLNNC